MSNNHNWQQLFNESHTNETWRTQQPLQNELDTWENQTNNKENHHHPQPQLTHALSGISIISQSVF